MRQEHNLLIVSDLHLSEGFDPRTGRMSRLEDFFSDGAFARLLRYHEEIKDQPRFGGRPWLLILNGDLFDFLQVTSLPRDGLPLRTVKDVDHRSDLSARERAYGLGTSAPESEWKLRQIARGHQWFFAALGWFAARGNHIAVVRGNHDAELHWQQVQSRFVIEARRAHARQVAREGGDPPEPLETIRRRVHFFPWIYHEPGRIYVEHGCQYDAANRLRNPLNPTLPDDPQRIELPWGSLFVRYLFNQVEDIHPFADNVKPLTRYLAWAFRTDASRALQVVLGRGGIFLKAFWIAARKTRPPAEESLHGDETLDEEQVPLSREIAEQIQALSRRRGAFSWRTALRSLLEKFISLLTIVITAAFLGLSVITLLVGGAQRWMGGVYAAAAVLALVLRSGLRQIFSRRPDHSDLLDAAFDLESILEPDHDVRIIAMGHNHRPMVKRLRDAWYVNTGAWVRLYEREGPIEGREALTFLRVTTGQRRAPELLRWDDAAGEPTRMVLWDTTEG